MEYFRLAWELLDIADFCCGSNKKCAVHGVLALIVRTVLRIFT